LPLAERTLGLVVHHYINSNNAVSSLPYHHRVRDKGE